MNMKGSFNNIKMKRKGEERRMKGREIDRGRKKKRNLENREKKMKMIG